MFSSFNVPVRSEQGDESPDKALPILVPHLALFLLTNIPLDPDRMSSSERLAQLRQADDLLAQDASHYPTIFPVFLTLAAQPDVPTRRWIASFLTRTFSSHSSLDTEVKESLLVRNQGAALDSILTLLADGNADAGVLKNTILSSSLIYPILFRKMYVPTPLCVPVIAVLFGAGGAELPV